MASYSKVLKSSLKEFGLGVATYGKRSTGSDGDETPETDDKFQDFPYIEDPKPFITNRAIEQVIYEQEPEAVASTNQAAPNQAVPGGGDMTDPGGYGGNMGGDLGAIGGIPGMDQPEPLTSTEIGRVYEMKKIYSRLTSVESFLTETEGASKPLLNLRKYVSQGIDLFEVVITNFTQFKDKIDPIIVTFYEFIDMVYETLRKYYKNESRRETSRPDNGS